MPKNGSLRQILTPSEIFWGKKRNTEERSQKKLTPHNLLRYDIKLYASFQRSICFSLQDDTLFSGDMKQKAKLGIHINL